MSESMGNNPAGIDAPDVFCPHCGYNLRGGISPVCPECGKPAVARDGRGGAGSRIPWMHHNALGRVDAYVRTARLALLKPSILAAEASVPVSYRAAARFRWITIAVTWPILAAVVWLLINGVPAAFWMDAYSFWSRRAPTREMPAVLLPLVLMTTGTHAWIPLVIALGPALVLVTASPAALFEAGARDRALHHRALALGHYAAAAALLLAAMTAPVLAAIAWATGVLDGYGFLTLLPAARVLIVAASIVLAVIWCVATVRIIAKATHASAGREIGAAVVWAAGVLAGLVGIAVLAMYLAGAMVIMWKSL